MEKEKEKFVCLLLVLTHLNLKIHTPTIFFLSLFLSTFNIKIFIESSKIKKMYLKYIEVCM